MQQLAWWVAIVAFLMLSWAIWGVIASYIAGLRGKDQLDAFKTGALFGPIGALMVLLGKDSVPDVHVVCPHCKTSQDVDGTLTWFECWQCEERTDVSIR